MMQIQSDSEDQRVWEVVEQKLRIATDGKYRIRGLLGSGGMAAVFLADDVKLRRNVAIKVMSPSLMVDPQLVRRFTSEATTTAQFRHPNIVTVFDVDEGEGLHYFAMTFIGGRSLASVIEEEGRLPIRVARLWLAQVASALGPERISRLRSTTTSTVELGYKGLIADKLVVTADVYSSTIRDFVGPLRVETPSVFLTQGSVDAYVNGRLAPAVMGGTITQSDVDALVATLAQVPVGTVAPDQRTGHDLLLTYRNFGDVNLWGFDLGVELLATEQLTLSSSLSFVSDDCFADEVGDCTGRAIALNAPQLKGSVGAVFEDPLAGFSVGARLRYTDGFPMNSGVYVGDVESYAIIDANVAYQLPMWSGATVSLSATNLLDRRHQEFIGAPFLGRMARATIEYAF